MNLFPRTVATLTLAAAAVPGVAAAATTPAHPQQHPAAHAVTRSHALVRPAVQAVVHPLVRPAAHLAVVHPAMQPKQNAAAMMTAAAQQAATFAVENLSQVFGGRYVVETVGHVQALDARGQRLELKLRIAQVQNEILGARKDCAVTVATMPAAKMDKLVSYTCQAVDAAVPAAKPDAAKAPAAEKAVAPLSALTTVKKVAAEKVVVERMTVAERVPSALHRG